MTRVDESEQAVRGLSSEDLSDFRRWFLAFDAHGWFWVGDHGAYDRLISSR